jgi:hypothetical protein
LKWFNYFSKILLHQITAEMNFKDRKRSLLQMSFARVRNRKQRLFPPRTASLNLLGIIGVSLLGFML